MLGRHIIANWDAVTEQMEENNLVRSTQIAYDSCAVMKETKVAYKKP